MNKYILGTVNYEMEMVELEEAKLGVGYHPLDTLWYKGEEVESELKLLEFQRKLSEKLHGVTFRFDEGDKMMCTWNKIGITVDIMEKVNDVLVYDEFMDMYKRAKDLGLYK